MVLKLIYIFMLSLLTTVVCEITEDVTETETANVTSDFHGTTTYSEETVETTIDYIINDANTTDLKLGKVKDVTTTTRSTTTSTTTTPTTTTTTITPTTTTTRSSSSSSTTSTTTHKTTSTTSKVSSTTPKDSSDESIFKAFNLNYLYFLLLIIPVVAVLIGMYCFCKRRKKRDGYVEPRVNKNRRFSTPSWVFSEPDFHDEEVTTLEQLKE